MMPDKLAPTVDALHVGTLGLLLEPMASTLVALIKREGSGRLVMLDPNIRPLLVEDEERYRQHVHSVIGRSAIVKAIEEDLAWLSPDIGYEPAVERLMVRGVRLVVATLGARGAYAAMYGARGTVCATYVVVVDTIGA